MERVPVLGGEIKELGRFIRRISHNIRDPLPDVQSLEEPRLGLNYTQVVTQ